MMSDLPASPSETVNSDASALHQPSPPTRPVRADVRLGSACCVLGLLVAFVVVPSFVRAPTPPRPVAMAPWFLPSAAAWMLVASGAALVFGALLRPRHRGGEGGGELPGLLRAASGLLVYVVLMPVLGAMTTGILVTTALAATSDGISPGRALGVGVAVPVLAWVLFTQLAGTPLPRGPWGLP